MLRVGPGVTEALPTPSTLERFFTGVEPLVFREVMLMFEGFVADIAHEGTNA